MTRKVLFSLVAVLFFGSALFAVPQDGGNEQSGGTGAPPGIDFPFVGEVEKDDVYLRSGCGENFKAFRKLRKGEKVVIQNFKGDWFSVSVPERFVAYINEVLVQEVEPGWLETTAEGKCLIRPLATTMYPSLIFLEGKGKRIRYLDKHGDWYMIIVPVKVPAWVSRKYVGFLGTLDRYESELLALSRDAEQKLVAEARTIVADQKKKAVAAGAGKQKSTAPPKAGETALEMDWAAELKAAEELLLKESKKKNPDLESFIPRFQKIKMGATDQAIQARANQRLRDIGIALKKKNGTLAEVEALQARDRKLRELEEIRRKKLIALEQKYSTPSKKSPKSDVVIGIVGRDWAFQSPTRFVLLKGGEIQMYLKSDRYNLYDFLNKEVALKGGEMRPLGLDFPILLVKKLEILAK